MNIKSRYKFFLAVFILLLCINNLNAQKYFLYHYNKNGECRRDINELYSDIDNIVIVRSEFAVKDVELVSDSIKIIRINDSIFNLRPICNNVKVRIKIVSRNNSIGLDSVMSNCIRFPISFSINRGRTDPYYSNLILFDMKKMDFNHTYFECYDISKFYTIERYDLVLKRKDSVIFRKTFKGERKISKSIRKKLFNISLNNDLLLAENIYLINASSITTKIENYPLLVIKKIGLKK